jgi:hypothetical protein
MVNIGFTGDAPGRFVLYSYVRQKKLDEQGHKTFRGMDDTITQDELNYYLKGKLMVPPEQRYQDKKKIGFSMNQVGIGEKQMVMMDRAAINLQAAFQSAGSILKPEELTTLNTISGSVKILVN